MPVAWRTSQFSLSADLATQHNTTHYLCSIKYNKWSNNFDERVYWRQDFHGEKLM